MNTITSREAALLGLLTEKPMHPYEIEKTVEFRSMRSWTEISMSTIYKTLVKLENRNLLRSELSINERNVTQKTYSVTDSGLEELRNKFMNDLSEIEPLKWQIDVALYNLPVLAPADAISQLKKYILNLEECIESYKKLEAYLQETKCQSFVLAISVRPQYLYKAEIDWARDFIKIIKMDGEKWKVKK